MSIFGLDASPNHFPAASLGDGRTWIICSRNAAKACVVFVHGFNGDALKTWDGFGTDALQDPALKETDLIFFGYDGVRSNALASASFLFDLVDDVMTAGAILRSVKPAAPAYERCVIAAHSLGAVVSRWALLRAFHEKRPWLAKTRYVLFAPAHAGGIIVNSVSELLGVSAITKLLGDAAKVEFPLLVELAPESPILRVLEEQTRAAIKAGCESLRARRVVIAEFENVVSNLPFADDPYPTAVRNAKHTTVCKPAEFHELIGYVTELLA